jgi:hypothetical protein
MLLKIVRCHSLSAAAFRGTLAEHVATASGLTTQPAALYGIKIRKRAAAKRRMVGIHLRTTVGIHLLRTTSLGGVSAPLRPERGNP